MTPTKSTFDLLKKLEGFKNHSYPDSKGIPTIGVGFTSGVKLGDYMSEDQIEARLESEVGTRAVQLNLLLKVGLSQNRWDALFSFMYNEGYSNLKSSNLLKLVNANPANPLIRKEFAKWDYVGGKIVDGLITRRQFEANLYFS